MAGRPLGRGKVGMLALAVALAGCAGDSGTTYETGATTGGTAGNATGGTAASTGQDRVPGVVAIGQAPVGLPQTPPSDASGTRPGARPSVPPASVEPVAGRPSQLGQFQNDPSRLEPLPAPAAEETTASGLQIVYTTEAQRDAIDPALVEAQWQHMQSCTEVVAPPPLVLVVEGLVRPITPSDDVIRAIDGAPLATASVGDAGTTLQVTETDLLPGAPNRGFALRAITGRWLWQGAALPDRDYPFACASERPPGTI